MTAVERAERVVLRECLHDGGGWRHPSACIDSIAAAIREAVVGEREACAAKVEEQSRLLTCLMESTRHEALCRDLARAIRARTEAAP